MKSIRPWAVWRRIFYLLGVCVFLLLVGGWTFLVQFYQPANCFDGVQNGRETGLDCGGNCVRICAFEVIPPKVVWVNSFEVNPGQYNSVAYIENPNQLAGSEQVAYTISLKSGDTVVAKRSGQTILPPNSVYPVFEGRIFTDNSLPVTETVIVVESPEVWQPATYAPDQFRSRNIELENADNEPRLNATIENTTLNTESNIDVVTTIFNASNQPVAASQTVIDRIAGQSTEDIIFTWPNSIAKTVRSCVIPTDVVLAIDLSGSMNNDNDNPPQPLTDTLAAASDFANNLGTEDALGLVTFASDALLAQPLTIAHNDVGASIRELTIDPVEETGFTNTYAALQAANRELNSTNHNDDARRVLVLLTDGLPTDSDDERDIVGETQLLAKEISDQGVTIYAIGLGAGADRSFVTNIASSPAEAFFAPNSLDLTQIYTDITESLCESGPARIDIIVKGNPTFTPLR